MSFRSVICILAPEPIAQSDLLLARICAETVLLLSGVSWGRLITSPDGSEQVSSFAATSSTENATNTRCFGSSAGGGSSAESVCEEPDNELAAFSCSTITD